MGPSRIPSRLPSRPLRMPVKLKSSQRTLHLEAWLVLSPSCSSTPSTTPVQGSPMMPRARVENANTTASSMSTGRPSRPTVSKACTVFHHLLRRYLHLPWHVLRHVRFPQAHPLGRQQVLALVLPLGLGCDNRLRPLVLPHRHHQASYDDDFRCRRQVQGLHRLRYADPQERRLHVHDEGSWCQRPPWCCWRWCLGWFRQVQGNLHRLQGWSIRIQKTFNSKKITTTHSSTTIPLRKKRQIKMGAK